MGDVVLKSASATTYSAQTESDLDLEPEFATCGAVLRTPLSVDTMAGQNVQRRLVISQMVLENFKSYAGAQHVGPFHKVYPFPP